MTPVVGLVRPGFTLTTDPLEVAEVFEVPLAFLVDPSQPPGGDTGNWRGEQVGYLRIHLRPAPHLGRHCRHAGELPGQASTGADT